MIYELLGVGYEIKWDVKYLLVFCNEIWFVFLNYVNVMNNVLLVCINVLYIILFYFKYKYYFWIFNGYLLNKVILNEVRY